MQSPEEFMKCFFRARTEEIALQMERRVPFRQRYFAPTCLWDSQNGAVERSEAETIVNISASNANVEVITQEKEPFPRLRYILQPSNESWLIERVDFEYPGGKGWVKQGEIDACLKSVASRNFKRFS